MADKLNAAIDAIAAELVQVAPELRDWLASPARPEELHALEQAVGTSVPADLAGWLARHNGQDARQFAVFDRWMLLSCSRIAQVHKMLCQTRELPGLAAIMPFEPSWIPFASDEAGSYLFSLPDNSVRCIDSDAREADAIAPDLATWLAAYAHDLRSGVLTFDRTERRLVRSDELSNDG